MQMKYLLVMGLPFTMLAGCGQQNGTTSGATAESVAQTDAPQASTAKEAADKSGGDHHPDAAGEVAAHTHSTKLDFSTEPGALPIGKPATWTLKITDAKSGQPVNDFEIEMTKLMHLIVVKNDLSWFNHIHPVFKGNGTFTVTTTLPSAGGYKLYADYMPKGKAQEVPQHEFATGGEQPSITSVLLVPDKMQGAWMTKKVTAHPESEPDKKGGATYEIALMPMPMPLQAGQDTMLHFQVRDAKGKPVKDLQPYLGAMGHAVILSSDTKQYLHSHPMAEGAEHDMSKMGKMDMSKMKEAPTPKSGGPDVMFHTNFPTSGQYKVWGQFMHKGQIITAAFVVNVGAAKTNTSNANSSAETAQDESQPHSH